MFGRCFIVLLFCATFARGETWHQHYEEALRALDEGHASEALKALTEAVAQRPTPGLRVATEGPRFVDYLPYLYLARAADMAGDVESARQYLARAEEAGVAEQSKEGRKVLEAYRILLGAAPSGTGVGGASSRPDYADYEPKEVVLSEEEYQQVRQGVLDRCGLDEKTVSSREPWFFHYEMGLELARRGDPQRALDALVEATEARPQSRKSSRMYGMWFIDYLPYFEMAKLHTLLGNRSCAADALRISREQGEVTTDDNRFADFLALEMEISERLATND